MRYPLVAYSLIRRAEDRMRALWDSGHPGRDYAEGMVGTCIAQHLVDLVSEEYGFMGAGFLQDARLFNTADVCRAGKYDPSTAYSDNRFRDLPRAVRAQVRRDCRNAATPGDPALRMLKQIFGKV